MSNNLSSQVANTVNNISSEISFVECPRDAMQGWPHQIATKTKIAYLNALLKVGFSVLDCGSFVSAKSIPQMSDTQEVLRGLDYDLLNSNTTKLLTIVANLRGAEAASSFTEVSYLGFPFSVSETFQLRNTNSTREQSFERVCQIHELCLIKNKELVIYLSMGFGNPYGDLFNPEILAYWTEKIAALGIQKISIADTVGLATPQQILTTLESLTPAFPNVTFGVHLHATKAGSQQKISAALKAGCRHFEGALKGIGGCPMAGDDLVGNMDTELTIAYLKQEGYLLNYNQAALKAAAQMTSQVFI